MRKNRLKRIAAILTIAAVLLAASCAFAAEKVITMGQTQGFNGFDQDNVILLNNLAIWQTAAVSKKPTNRDVVWKLIQTDSGQYYLDVDNFGRVEVRPLKLIINATRATETVPLEVGKTAELTGAGKWRLLTTVRGKKLIKGDRAIIAYDEFDRVHRMISWDDTWQVAVQKE